MSAVKTENVRNLILVNMRGTKRQNEFAQYLLVKFDSVSEHCNAEEEFKLFTIMKEEEFELFNMTMSAEEAQERWDKCYDEANQG